MSITRKQFLVGSFASTAALFLNACSDDEGSDETFDSLNSTEGPGDGDGDPSGDGDGDPTGDGDGDPVGDGDGDPTGDGDGDPGDGDGDPGDGDGDPGDGDGDPGDGDGDPGDGDGDPGDGDGDVPPVCPDGASGAILTNHGHTLIIAQADVEAGIQKDYNIQGGANHSHTITLTPGDFSQLALGNEVQKQSSFLVNHDHLVIIACLL